MIRRGVTVNALKLGDRGLEWMGGRGGVSQRYNWMEKALFLFFLSVKGRF